MLDSHLFTWKPELWPWPALPDLARSTTPESPHLEPWSCGRIKNIEPAARALLIRLGADDPGIVGVGRVVTAPTEKAHWDPLRACRGDRIMMVELELRRLSQKAIIPLEELQQRWPATRWTPQQSGTRVPPALGKVIEMELQR